ncbi:hypothetical protein [Nostoc sp.]|uniref:hypothetical protein n=1 Tax=Nostoc sp. TaxID=1180 RepID=UPI002FF56DC1
MENPESDKRQKQSKKRKHKQWLKWLRKPQTLRLLFQLGPVIFKLLKWLIELLQN